VMRPLHNLEEEDSILYYTLVRCDSHRSEKNRRLNLNKGEGCGTFL
jgi:hypothetical protein